MTRHADLSSFFDKHCKVKRIGRGHYKITAQDPSGLNGMLKQNKFATDMMSDGFLVNGAYWMPGAKRFVIHVIDNNLLRFVP